MCHRQSVCVHRFPLPGDRIGQTPYAVRCCRSIRAAASAQLRRRVPGFTLIEILVVVVVIAILATLVAPNVFQHVGTARETTARSQIEMFGAALDAYRLHVGSYPSTADGLASLWERPASAPMTWRGPYLRKAPPLDPWGNAYVYQSPGEVNRDSYDLLSLGADGRRGGDRENADITSW